MEREDPYLLPQLVHQERLVNGFLVSSLPGGDHYIVYSCILQQGDIQGLPDLTIEEGSIGEDSIFMADEGCHALNLSDPVLRRKKGKYGLRPGSCKRIDFTSLTEGGDQ